MSRSRNSRKGRKHTKQGGRHSQCSSPGCSYCARNFQIQSLRAQGVKGWKRILNHLGTHEDTPVGFLDLVATIPSREAQDYANEYIRVMLADSKLRDEWWRRFYQATMNPNLETRGEPQ
jgi:hypothetical protein